MTPWTCRGDECELPDGMREHGLTVPGGTCSFTTGTGPVYGARAHYTSARTDSEVGYSPQRRWATATGPIVARPQRRRARTRKRFLFVFFRSARHRLFHHYRFPPRPFTDTEYCRHVTTPPRRFSPPPPPPIPTHTHKQLHARTTYPSSLRQKYIPLFSIFKRLSI